MQVYHLRLELAVLIGKLDPLPRSETDLERIRAILKDCSRLLEDPDPQAIAQINMDFFQELSAMIGNAPLKDISKRLYYMTHRIWLASVPNLNLQDEIIAFQREVADILAAMEVGDLEAVGHIRRSHISMSVKRMQKFSEKIIEMTANPISATVDFMKDGVQHGFLRLPYSRDDSAWGSVMIPITVARNGDGPTALLTGANHGEEYEGPVALMDLAQSIRAEDLSGRVIIIPAMNYPAFRTATRTSPIDRGNMNRSFPGKPDGTVTQKIADYFQRVLLPMADVVLDIHAGGKTLDFIPFACAHRLPDKALEARCVAAMEAFAAPYSMMLLEIDSVGMYDTQLQKKWARCLFPPNSAAAEVRPPVPTLLPNAAYAMC